MKRAKKYKQVAEKIDPEAFYAPDEALKIVRENRTANFDETVEIHFRLGIDPRQADQQIRGTVTLPNGTGRAVKVAVFAQGEEVKEAEDAGADIVGGAELAEKVQKGFLDFDVAVATPDMMGTVGKLGRILGPRGLMPNPKAGTVSFEVGKAVKELKRGKIEYRADKFGIVHMVLGKTSFEQKALVENYLTVYEELLRAKPSKAKGRYIRSVSIVSTMGPGIKVDHNKIPEHAKETV